MTAITYVDLVSWHPIPWLALVNLLLGPLGGYCFGCMVWSGAERRYLAARAAERNEQEHKAALDALAQEVRELRQTLTRTEGH